jgi:toxin ParE1/3/4
VKRPRIIRRPSAIEDLVAQGIYYVQHASPETAARFLDAAGKAFRLLARRPRLGHPWRPSSRRLAGVLVWPIKGFRKHLIFYRPLPDGIEVLHVFHGSRDLSAILEALEEDEEG